MKFSENAHYLEYMTAFADGRYDLATEALERCLKDFDDTSYQKSFLLTQLGEISFLQGDVDRCLGYFALAEDADPESLQPRYVFAEFLARRLRRFEEASMFCGEIIEAATANPFAETDEEFSSAYYIAKANALKDYCASERGSAQDE
jgi:tetratricopeptide (TPR) repeat protein